MKRSIRALVVVSATLVAPQAASGSIGDVAAPVDPVSQAVTGDGTEYVVLYQPGTNVASETRDLQLDTEVVVQDVFTDVVPAVAIDATDAAIAEIARDPAVLAVEPNREFTLGATQSDPSWSLDRIDQRSLPLDSSYTYPDSAGLGVDIYVVDTGVKPDHVDFGGRVVSGYTTIDDTYGTDDCHGHGTHVASTSAGSTWGVAKRATIVPVRVLSCGGSGSLFDIVDALNWIASVASGPSVVNMSLGAPGSSPTIDAAIDNLVARGVTVVVAAGNDDANACDYTPASTSSALTVGATDSSDSRAWFSNYGTCLDLFAPGVDITAAYPTSSQAVASMSGTSMASPHVAGVVALLLAASPTASPAEVRSTLLASALDNVVSTPGAGSSNELLQVPIIGAPPAEFAKLAPIVTTETPIVSRTSTTLSWEAANGAQRYEVCVATTTTCPSRSWVSTSTTSYTKTKLRTETTYFWWVRALNDAGATFADGAEAASFRVSVPTIPMKSLPTAVRGSEYTVTLGASGGRAPFTWSSSSLPSGLRIDGDVLTGAPLSVGTARFTLTATDANGASVSKSVSLRVSLPPPGAFAKTSPSTESVLPTTDSAILSWGSALDVQRYEVCVSTTPLCSSTSWRRAIGTSFTVTRLMPNSVYYWQVRAINGSGRTFADSGNMWSFTTAP